MPDRSFAILPPVVTVLFLVLVQSSKSQVQAQALQEI
jgi:hypothetical protein